MEADEPTVSAAQWMLDRLTAEGGELLQLDAACGLEELFGEACVYYNRNGNPAIVKAVLEQFRELTGDRVVWSKSGRYWRYRDSSDAPGREQA